MVKSITEESRLTSLCHGAKQDSFPLLKDLCRQVQLCAELQLALPTTDMHSYSCKKTIKISFCVIYSTFYPVK